MGRHSRVIRCLHLILLSVWRVADIAAEDELFGTGPASDLSTPGAECACWNGHVWLCRGDRLLRVPSNLTVATDTMTLKLRDAGIKTLPKDSLAPYAGTLQQLYLVNVPEFETLAPGVFRNITKLQTIYISHAPKLTHIHKEVFNVYLPRLKEIRILRAALHTLPYLGNLISKGILDTVDFENNKIQRIDTAWIKIRSADLYLNYNEITSVDSMAFNGSEIGKLSLKGNRALTSIHTDAFVGIANINSLDLSETSITTLPTRGLQYIQVLKIENTRTLKVFPSKYNFETLVRAHLTYPCHCCAFKFPAKHNPEMHELMMKMKQRCPPPTTRRSVRDSRSLPDSDGVFGDPVDTPGTQILTGCDAFEIPTVNVTCYPKPDALNPCEDIMGYWSLRIAVWLVAILAILGNLAVLIVLISFRSDMTVPKLLMCNLALADLCMGFYLTLIAGMDAASIGEYFNHAIDWQSGLGCQVAGFLTVFSTELSIFTLTIITSERWYTITYAIHLDRRLKMKTSAKIMAVGWVYACIMAALPLADVSGYGPTSICLPFANRDVKDLLYLVTLLVFNGLAFLAIIVCYGRMYSSVRSSREEATPMARTDMTVAKKMALLVFTDFVCWAPIAFFAITALAGQPLISVTKTKILLVFVYPLNSCANPYLYALLTHQYRRDVCIFLARHGMCKERAAKYKGLMGGRTPTGGHSRNHGVTRDKWTTSNRQGSSAHNNNRTSVEVSSGGIVINNGQDAAVEFGMTSAPSRSTEQPGENNSRETAEEACITAN